AFAGETRLFEARKATIVGQRAQLREQVAQLNQEIDGLGAQLAAKDDTAGLVQRELTRITGLFAQNLTTSDKLTALQRDASDLQGQRGDLVATIARARGKIAETELQILQ